MKILLLVFFLFSLSLSCDEYEYTCTFNSHGQSAQCRFFCPPGRNCNCTCPSNFFKCNVFNFSEEFSYGTNALMSETLYQMHIPECIPDSKKDDGYYDCPGKEDETYIPLWKLNKTICEGAFQCNSFSSLTCIDRNFLCDGKIDCYDKKDEENCNYSNLTQYPKVEDGLSLGVVCSEDEFNCGKFCIPSIWKSDGHIDCPNKKDEENAIGGSFRCSPEAFRCSPEAFRCPFEPKCVEKDKVCDGVSDCLGAYDELNCKFVCPEGKFRCTNGQCVEKILKCDGTIDCKDGTDEHGCANLTYRNKNIFICRHSDIHISDEFLCDGTSDCPDNSDEFNCTLSSNCDRKHFECKKNKICIPSVWRCDGDKDCPDGSDEDTCVATYSTPPRCPGTLKLCQDGSCKKFCPSKCESDSYTCPDGECIKYSEICSTKNCKNENICNSTNVIFGCDVTKDPNCQKKTINSQVTVYQCKFGFSNFWGRGCESDNRSIFVEYCRINCKMLFSYLGFMENCMCYPGFRKLYGSTVEEFKGARYRVDSGNKAELLLTAPDQILKYNFHSKKLVKIGNTPEDPIAGSIYFLKNQILIWNNLKTRKIMKCNFPFFQDHFNGKCKNKTTVVSDVISYYLSVDWTHELLYYVNEEKLSICVLKMASENQIPMTVIQGSYQHFRGLQLDPSNGVLFFIASGRIYRAGLDGSKVTVITEDLHRPTSLFLDFYNKKVYFSDSKRGRIYSVDYFGNVLIKHFTSRKSINPIYSITVFEDHLYFEDENGLHLISPKNNKHPQRLTPGSGYPMFLQTVHETAQPKFVNKCEKNICENFCFPINNMGYRFSGNRSYTCGCPDGFRIVNETSCVPKKNEKKIHIETTTITISIPTVSDEIKKEKIQKSNLNIVIFSVVIATVLLISIIGVVCLMKNKNSKKTLSENSVNFNDLKVREQMEDRQLFNPSNSKVPVIGFGNPCYNDTVQSQSF